MRVQGYASWDFTRAHGDVGGKVWEVLDEVQVYGKGLGTKGNREFLAGNVVIVPTHMVEQAKLKLNLVGKPVDHTDYHSMIESLMYVTSSRPDIMFVTCMCARY
nr:hypothetical protein [Tanacetum cinerariifolium]